MLTTTVSLACNPPESDTLAVMARLPNSVLQLNVFQVLPPLLVAGVPGPDHCMLPVRFPFSVSEAVAAKDTAVPQGTCCPSLAGVVIVTVGGEFTAPPGGVNGQLAPPGPSRGVVRADAGGEAPTSLGGRPGRRALFQQRFGGGDVSVVVRADGPKQRYGPGGMRASHGGTAVIGVSIRRHTRVDADPRRAHVGLHSPE